MVRCAGCRAVILGAAVALIQWWCCGDGQPSGEDWYVVLTFGDDQKGFKLQFATDEGKEICAKVSATAC